MTPREHISAKFSRCSIMTRRVSSSFIQICAYLAFVATIVIGQECDKTKCPGPLAYYEALGCEPVYKNEGDCCAEKYNCSHLKERSKREIQERDECDKTKCPGPLKYYEALGCEPVYKNEGDCCAEKYNCNHLNERSKTKCYVNGKEYKINETLKDEDANPCDIGCRCRSDGDDGVAAFNCAVVDCFFGPVQPGCYRKRSPLDCCPGEEVCPEKRPTCNVNGKIYQDGEYFEVEDDPDLNCVCQEGYKGENVEPFCLKPRHPYCSPDFRSASDVFNKCAPVYYSSQPPQTSCSVSSRCQNANDTVLHNEDNSKSAETPSEDDVCDFGNLKMHVGDELNQATDYSSVCVKCVCEVPPTPTCQRLPDNECDVTKHPPFGDF